MKKINVDLEDIIVEVAGEGLEAFWDVVVRAFPEANSGDVSPLVETGFQNAAYTAVRDFVKLNTRLFERVYHVTMKETNLVTYKVMVENPEEAEEYAEYESNGDDIIYNRPLSREVVDCELVGNQSTYEPESASAGDLKKYTVLLGKTATVDVRASNWEEAIDIARNISPMNMNFPLGEMNGTPLML